MGISVFLFKTRTCEVFKSCHGNIVVMAVRAANIAVDIKVHQVKKIYQNNVVNNVDIHFSPALRYMYKLSLQIYPSFIPLSLNTYPYPIIALATS